MQHTLRILWICVFFLTATAFWLIAATQALAADSAAPKPAEGGMSDYMLSYMIVIAGIVLGLLVVARSSHRRDRDRPAGYVEKNLMADK